MEIIPLRQSDCDKTASAHIEHLATPYKTKAGLKLLTTHYEVISTQQGGIGYIAEIDGIFAGFVCGIWDRAAIRKGMRKHWPKMAWNAMRHTLEDPMFLRNSLNKLMRFHKKEMSIDGYELRPIVVLPEFRGQGVAEKLVETLLKDASGRGFTQVFLLTEHDNQPAIKFYSRFGFVQESEVELHGGTTFETIGKVFRYYMQQ